MKLVNGVLSGINGLTSGDQNAERRRYADDLESAAGYVNEANPGFTKHRAFYDYLKRGLSGPHRRFFDEIMQRPTIKTPWDAAEAVHREFMLDINRNNATDDREDQPEADFGAVWGPFRAEFLGEERAKWHSPHRQ